MNNMPILSNSENKNQQVVENTRKETLVKFFCDFKESFLIWIKIGGITVAGVILLYLFARFILKWDILYETNVNFSAGFFVVAIGFIISIVVCWFVAFFLYNTKHRRTTKYKSLDIGRGGN